MVLVSMWLAAGRWEKCGSSISDGAAILMVCMDGIMAGWLARCVDYSV